MQQQIKQQLRKHLNVYSLDVMNESHLHAGHNNFDGTGDSHFRIIISAEELDQLTRVKAHQLIYSILALQMKVLHALSIEIIPIN